VLANRADLASLRGDVEGTNAAAAMTKALGQSVRPIPLGPDLLSAFPDQTRRMAFLRQWQQAIGVKP
jgi:iron(III) transport system substrate-binding protein